MVQENKVHRFKTVLLLVWNEIIPDSERLKFLTQKLLEFLTYTVYSQFPVHGLSGFQIIYAQL